MNLKPLKFKNLLPDSLATKLTGIRHRFPVLYDHYRSTKVGISIGISQLFPWMKGQRFSPLDTVMYFSKSTVSAGPFKGMKYIWECSGSVLTAKILGTYEKEIQGVIERLKDVKYEFILNIGCGEGYYAVGFALSHQEAKIYTYDINSISLLNLATLSKINNVEQRIRTNLRCTHESLQELEGRNVLIFCDIEGEEKWLLNPERAPALTGFDLLVELHDGPSSSGIKDILTKRFSYSHNAEFFRYSERTAFDFPTELDMPLTAEQKRQLLDENRKYGIEWAFFSAISNRSQRRF